MQSIFSELCKIKSNFFHSFFHSVDFKSGKNNRENKVLWIENHFAKISVSNFWKGWHWLAIFDLNLRWVVVVTNFLDQCLPTVFSYTLHLGLQNHWHRTFIALNVSPNGIWLCFVVYRSPTTKVENHCPRFFALNLLILLLQWFF